MYIENESLTADDGNNGSNGNNKTRVSKESKTKQSVIITKSEKDRLLGTFDTIDTDFEIETTKSRWIEGTFICLSACIVALEVKNLNLMLTLAGATYGCYIMFILPSMLYIKSINETKRQRILNKYEKMLVYCAYAMLVLGAVIAVAGVTTAFV